MRKSLLAAIAVSLLLIGCKKIDPKIYSQDGPVADGDMLIDATIGDAKTLMPPLVDEVGGADIYNVVFDGLLRFDEKLRLQPGVAEKWKVSKDGKSVTYYLRKGVKFHDGVEMTAEDVAFTYKVYSDPNVNTPAGAQYQEIKNVEIMDPYIVKVVYKKPYAPGLATTFDAILPKHLLEGKDINTSDFGRHPIGTGPYKFVEWKTDQKIVLEANPDYWGGKPHIKRLVMRIIPDPATQFLELLNGGIDSLGSWLHSGLTPEEYARQTDTPKFKDYYNSFKSDSLAYSYIGWNLLNPLFKDKKVRQALTMALDRQTIVQNVLFGNGVVCTGPMATVSWAYNPSVKPWPYDPEKAKKFLKEAGWRMAKDGLLHKTINHKDTPFKFTLLTNQGNVSRERVATIVQQQLRQIGIQVDIQIYEWTTFLTQYVNPKKFDAVILGWSLTPDPDGDLYPTWHSSQTGEHQFNFISYKNKTIDTLLVEGRRTLDPKKRQKIYWRIHSILADEQPYTFLYIPNELPAIHKRFKGYQPLQLWDPQLLTYQNWYVPTGQQKYQP